MKNIFAIFLLSLIIYLKKAQSNGLGLCRYNENTSICVNGNPILTSYDDYYKKEARENGQPHYLQLWDNKEIYKAD